MVTNVIMTLFNENESIIYYIKKFIEYLFLKYEFYYSCYETLNK